MDNIANQATLLYNNMTTNSNTVTTQILSLYDLTATKEALLDTYTPNQTITYVTRVENTGSASLYNLTVVDDLAKGLTQYVDNSVEGYLNGTPIEVNVQITNNTVIFTIDNVINPNDNVLIIFETTTPTTRPDVLTNTQTITANGSDQPLVLSLLSHQILALLVKLANYVSFRLLPNQQIKLVFIVETHLFILSKLSIMVMKLQQMFTFSDVFPTGYYN